MIGEYFSTIQISIGEKLATIISSIFTTLAGLAIAFYYGVIFALILLGYVIFMMITMSIWGKSIKSEYI